MTLILRIFNGDGELASRSEWPATEKRQMSAFRMRWLKHHPERTWTVTPAGLPAQLGPGQMKETRQDEITRAGAHACITASCLTHRVRVFWQSAERRWVHTDCRPCEPARKPLAGLVAAFDAERARIEAQHAAAVARVIARGSDPAAAAEAEGDFGPGAPFSAAPVAVTAAAATIGQGTLFGQGELFGDGA